MRRWSVLSLALGVAACGGASEQAATTSSGGGGGGGDAGPKAPGWSAAIGSSLAVPYWRELAKSLRHPPPRAFKES